MNILAALLPIFGDVCCQDIKLSFLRENLDRHKTLIKSYKLLIQTHFVIVLQN